MLLAGVPISYVSRHLGHTSITMTVNTYGHIDKKTAREAAAATSDVRRLALGEEVATPNAS
jgi:integrase